MSMRAFVGAHEVRDEDDLLELALGTPLALWLGEGPDETDEERAARQAAARDILAEDPGLIDRVTSVAAQAAVDYLPALCALPAPRTTPRRTAALVKAVAA